VITEKIIFGLATAVSALALFATPALAKEWECEKGTKCRFKVEAKNQQKFKVGETTVECRKSRISGGQLVSPSADLQYKPTFEACTATVAAIKHEAKVEVKECEFRLILNEGTGSKQQGVVTIKGAKCLITIVVKGTTCEITIGERANKELKKFRAEQVLNKETKLREVQIQAEVKGIKLTKATSGCGLTKAQEEEGGKYVGRGRVINNSSTEGIKIRKS